MCVLLAVRKESWLLLRLVISMHGLNMMCNSSGSSSSGGGSNDGGGCGNDGGGCSSSGSSSRSSSSGSSSIISCSGRSSRSSSSGSSSRRSNSGSSSRTSSSGSSSSSSSSSNSPLTCPHTVLPAAVSHRPLYAVCCALSNALDCASHFILLQELGAYGLSGGYAGKFRSYVTDRLHFVCIADIVMSSFAVLSSAPQGFPRAAPF